MRTLVDLFRRIESLGGREALGLYNGYRTRKSTYAELTSRSRAVAGQLVESGIAHGERVLIWAENSPEWAAAFWGCVLHGSPAVPLDARSDPEFVARVARRAEVKLVVAEPGYDADFPAPVLRTSDLLTLPDPGDISPSGRPITPQDVAEIVFTSGSTSEPKGVVHRHSNICSNLTGVAREIERYRTWAAPFQPIRLLDMLPLSHMFGQTMGLFIPPLLGGAVLFSSRLSAPAMLEAIRREKASALVAVPLMAAQLKDELERRSKRKPRPLRLRGAPAILESWFRHRDLHALTGWKFWALVVGGATLDEGVEEFYRRVGFAVIQGYGLTEASPVVAVNHPFSTRKGSIGKALPGQEIRLAPDGEILVRGASVASEFLGDAAGSDKIRDGWLHTGDIGERDEDGRLYFRGRKGDIIVRPDGLNVFPADVESVLNRLPDIAECAVVGVDGRVHAALSLKTGARDAREIVAGANDKLADHQKIQDWSIWGLDELPRTTSTRKIRRGELTDRIAAGGPRSAAGAEAAAFLGAKGDDLADLEAELAVSSLERVELLARAEEQTGREISDEEFSRVRTVGQLQELLRAAGTSSPSAQAPGWLLRPTWNRNVLVRALRGVAQDLIIFPLSGRLIEIETRHAERLGELTPPVLFIANHVSHFDTLVFLRALPKRWRRRVAPAMSQDYFRALFDRSSPWRNRIRDLAQYSAACGLFNAYPLPQSMSGTRRALRYTGELVDAGLCPLLYPEGTRSTDGRMLPFRPGVGLMAMELGLTVVPVHLWGLFEIYSVHHEQPRKGKASVRFGEPLDLSGATTYEEAALQAERAMRRLAEEAKHSSESPFQGNGNPSVPV